jgi:hypothetical protein
LLGSLGGFFFLFLRNFCKSSAQLVEIAYLAAKERVSGESQYSTASIVMLENRVLAIETAQSKLADSYAAEITPEAIYTPKMKAWANELVALKAEIKKLKGKSNEGGFNFGTFHLVIKKSSLYNLNRSMRLSRKNPNRTILIKC